MLKGSVLHEEFFRVHIFFFFRLGGDVHTHRFDVYLHRNAKHDEKLEVNDNSIYCR